MLPASDGDAAPSRLEVHVTRRNVDYTVTVFACSIDDPTDGAGQGDATFCARRTRRRQPRPAAPARGRLRQRARARHHRHGRGSAARTVCNAVGTNTAIASDGRLVLSPVAPSASAPDGADAGNVAFDSDPDDMRRVRVDVSWTRGGAGSVSQTTLLTNPLQN